MFGKIDYSPKMLYDKRNKMVLTLKIAFLTFLAIGTSMISLYIGYIQSEKDFVIFAIIGALCMFISVIFLIFNIFIGSQSGCCFHWRINCISLKELDEQQKRYEDKKYNKQFFSYKDINQVRPLNSVKIICDLLETVSNSDDCQPKIETKDQIMSKASM